MTGMLLMRRTRPAARRAASLAIAISGPRRSFYDVAAAAAVEPARHDKQGRPSTVDDILARRARAGKLVAGIAAPSDSDMFKGEVSGNLLLQTMCLMY